MEDKILEEVISSDRRIIESMAADKDVDRPVVVNRSSFYTSFRFIRTGLLYLLLLAGAVSINYFIIERIDGSGDSAEKGFPSLASMSATYDGSVNRALERLFENEKSI